MPRRPRERPLVFDSSSLIALEKAKELRVLSYLSVCIPKKVAEEVGKGGSDLKRWLDMNPRVVTHMLPVESAEFLRLMVSSNPAIDDGEAVAIAIARNRGLRLVIEDRAGRIVASQLGVECVSADDLVAQTRML